MSLDQSALIDHLDNTLQGKGSPETERQISDDPSAGLEWQYLQLAVDAVKDAALYEQVESVKLAWMAQRDSAATPPYTVPGRNKGLRGMYRSTLRIAACLLILAGGTAVFKYTTTSSTGLYNKYYTGYTLNANRSSAAEDAVELAYRKKDWTTVLMLFSAAREKNNKLFFLAGMADLELKKYNEAVGKFEQVIAANLQSGNDYFQDEAEYYLAMSCLARNDVNEAIPLLDKIRSNKDHLFHDRAVKMSFLDLRILQYKNYK